jgi:ribosomal protein S18 acetylase RimI-like enzyme
MNLPFSYHLQDDFWLTEQFSYPVKKLQLGEGGETGHIADDNKIFIYATLPVEKTEYVNDLMQEGFSLIETQLQFKKNNTSHSNLSTVSVRFANDQDKDALLAIAESSFSHSRFHKDPNIPNELANKIKRNWVANYFSGARGTHMVVGLDKDKPVGFTQIIKTQSDDMIIDLIAVDEPFRGKGFARAMITFAANNIPKIQKLIVGTQLTNYSSIASYQKLGFTLDKASYTLHYHGKAG